MSQPPPSTGPLVAVVADDLIWASRLIDAVARAGAAPVRLGTARDVAIALEATALEEPVASEPGRPFPAPARLVGAIVDLFGHRYDGVAVVRDVTAACLPVIAVAEHDDLETRKRALDAGALRVFSYNKFFTDGPRLVGAWLAATEGTA